jgi:hypothetical protein
VTLCCYRLLDVRCSYMTWQFLWEKRVVFCCGMRVGGGLPIALWLTLVCRQAVADDGFLGQGQN